MKQLYCVALYNHTLNVWTRILLTADSSDAAAAGAKEGLEDENYLRWKVRSISAVCTTSDDIWMEV